MAKEIVWDGTTGETQYAMLRNSVGQIYNTAGVAFEAYNAANIADYDIAGTEQGSGGTFTADMPAVAAGIYNVTAKKRVGGAPAESDPTVGVGELDWNGTAAIGVSTVLPAKNTALPNIPFMMVAASDHVSPTAGLTVTATKSLDGGATFGATTGTVTEIGSGAYSFDASAADMNGTMVIFKFSAATADDTFLSIKTGG